MSKSSQTNSVSSLGRLFNRRGLLAQVAPAAFLLCPSIGLGNEPASQASTKRKSRQLVRPETQILDTRAKIVLQLQGNLLLPNLPKEKQGQDIEVKAESTLDYFEQIAFEQDAEQLSPLVSARRYNEAKVKNWIAGNSTDLELRDACRETRLLEHEGTWSQFCPNEQIDERETHLLHSPVNTAALDLLLPVEPATPSSTWELAAADAKDLFNLEAVHQCELKSKISKVEKGVATIALQGTLEGTIHSVPTKIQVEGSYQAKTSTQGVIVTWLGVVLKEQRAASLAEPGFDLTARIRLIRAETPTQKLLSEAQLRKVASQQDEGRWLMRIESKLGRYKFLSERNWSVYADTGEEAVLKLVSNNSLVAQCNVTRLAKLEEGTQLTAAALQADIKAAVGKQFGEFLETTEDVNSAGIRVIRSVVAGKAEDVPIQWIYNHLSDDSGRRYLMVFTMGATEVEKFAAADIQLASSFAMLPEVDDAKPTPAPEVEQAPTLSASKEPTSIKE